MGSCSDSQRISKQGVYFYAPCQTTACCLIVARLCQLQVSLRIVLAGSFPFLMGSCVSLCCSSAVLSFLATLCSFLLVSRIHSCHVASCVKKLPTPASGHQAHLASELLLQVQCWILFCQLGCRLAESADSPIHWSSYRFCHNPPQDRTNHRDHHCFDHDPGEHCSSHLPILFFSLRLCTVGTMLGLSLLTGQQCC